jgi:hypothetical protein
MFLSGFNIIPLQKIGAGIEMFVGGFPKPQIVFSMEQQKGVDLRKQFLKPLRRCLN